MPNYGDQHLSNGSRYGTNGGGGYLPNNNRSWSNGNASGSGTGSSGNGGAAVNGTNFTIKESNHIRQQLGKQLGPEYISHRPGGGGLKVPYLEGWKVINLANEVFGFNGWSSEIINHEIDYCDEIRDGRFNLGMSAKIRVTLRDGTYREDVGYGQVENARSKGMAFDKCKKEATTDGLKRALRLFGNALGNCLYDSSYTRNISRVKVSMPPFDESQLIRRPEIVTMQKAAAAAKAAREAAEAAELEELAALNTSTKPSIKSEASTVAASSTPQNGLAAKGTNLTAVGTGNNGATSRIANNSGSGQPSLPSLPTKAFAKPDGSGVDSSSTAVSGSLDFMPAGFLDSDDMFDDHEFAEIDGLPYIAPREEPVPAPARVPLNIKADTSIDTTANITANTTADLTSNTTANTTANITNESGTTTNKPNKESEDHTASPVQFFSARAALAVQKDMIPENSQFDPSFQSPSLRRTVPNKSVPIKKSSVNPLSQDPQPPTLASDRTPEPDSRKRMRLD
ncbi:recombinase RAD52 [Sugiyamaella lignohabitans]|uniref:DNA repair and recombination protein RAD52 n=1 Tax=Sugiyamaella lignohabitans TaxID=796027 RepID=A0A161HL63_9ASCO|nr:recombinase RAD52 [Sugiyamaella lignohabitans]ANB13957.1 recombinase RAD52 [Sugiyamaella lignohabitans]